MARDLLGAAPRLRRAIHRLQEGIAALLPIELARLAAHGVGTVLWFLDAPGRARVARNLAPFVPTPAARARAVRRSFAACAMATAEGMRCHRLPARAVRGRLDLCDPHRAFAGRPLAGPLVFATIHANWELLLTAERHLDVVQRFHAVALGSGDPGIDADIARRRAALGCHDVLLERAPLAGLRALRDGGCLGILADRDYGGHGRVVPFAGRRLRLPPGPAELAVRLAGCWIAPSALLKRSWQRGTLVVGRPLLPRPARPREAEVRRLGDELARELARLIAAAPAQWVAFHEVFEP